MDLHNFYYLYNNEVLNVGQVKITVLFKTGTLEKSDQSRGQKMQQVGKNKRKMLYYYKMLDE